MKITCSKCGEFLDLDRIFRQRYCKDCQNEHARLNRKSFSELTPFEKKKYHAREDARANVRRGKINRKACQKCGSEKAEMHHEDYNMPLSVIWLCRTCHIELHNWKKILEKEPSEVKEA